MKTRRLLKKSIGVLLILSMLLGLCGCQLLEYYGIIPDTSEPPLSDKEMLIQQIKRDMNTDEDIVEFDIKPFATAESHFCYAVKITIIGDEIYINDYNYDTVKVEQRYETVYKGLTYRSPLEIFDKGQISDLIDKIQRTESCYSLYTIAPNSNLTRTSIYIIDGVYYFIYFFTSGDIGQIYYADFNNKITYFSPDMTAKELFAIIEADAIENKKLKHDVNYEELHYKYKNDSKYDYKAWMNSRYHITISINYDQATDEEWYFDITGNKYEELNDAMFDQHRSKFPNAIEIYSDIYFDSVCLNYGYADELYADYEAIKALTKLDYIEKVSISYSYSVPNSHFHN